MASNKTGIRKAAGTTRKGLGSALIRIVAIGFSGGAVLIGIAKAFGEALENKQTHDAERLEKRRDADRENARRITAAETGTDIEVSE